jgi:hypothetical protein
MLGCIAVVMIPIPVLFKVYGPWLRERSKLACSVLDIIRFLFDIINRRARQFTSLSQPWTIYLEQNRLRSAMGGYDAWMYRSRHDSYSCSVQGIWSMAAREKTGEHANLLLSRSHGPYTLNRTGIGIMTTAIHPSICSVQGIWSMAAREK